MTIRVPDTLNVSSSEKYEVSIRLWPDGLSFSGYVPTEKDSFFSETVLFDGGVSVAQSLKDIFFENQCFSYVYKSLYVVCVSGKYTLVPENVFLEEDKESLFSFCHQEHEKGKVLAQPLEKLQLQLLFYLDNEVYQFLMRSLVNPRFIHSMSPLLLSWQKKSLASYPKQIYAFIHDKMLDIACFERGEMLFLNSFDYENESDIVYYMMYICRQIGANQLEDNIYFCGDKNECSSVASIIRKYLRNADYLPPYPNSLADKDKDMYMDIVTLKKCAL